jgi:hypothetical protein
METESSSILDDPVAQLLLTGHADTGERAERLYLEEHLDEVLELVNSPLCDEEFHEHQLIASCCVELAAVGSSSSLKPKRRHVKNLVKSAGFATW